MKEGKYEVPSEPLYNRLITDAAITAIVKDRIKPNQPTQGFDGAKKPYISFWRITGGGNKDLTGRSGLQNYFFRIEFHAETDDEAEVLRELVLNRLCGNPRKGIAAWIDRTQGVLGCFAQDDADADTDDDGFQISGQTVSLHFCPQI